MSNTKSNVQMDLILTSVCVSSMSFFSVLSVCSSFQEV